MDTTAIIAGVGLFTTLAGALGAAWLAGRSQRTLNRLEERRRILDEAAICRNKSEALARNAWRELLGLQEMRDDRSLDDLLANPPSDVDFPERISERAQAAVEEFAEHLPEVRAATVRLMLRLDEETPAVKAFIVSENNLSDLAYVMMLAVGGMNPSHLDLESAVQEFFAARDAGSEFVSAARRLVT